MSKIFWKSFLTTPAVLLSVALVSPQAQAQLETEQYFTNQEVSDQQTEILNQLDSYTKENKTRKDQVTSVSQLRDVSPTDWAYEALRSLVERYGCIVGYPDRTYRGNRALSRYEFAAGLNACMQQMERLIAQSEAVLKEDIETLKRLMKEFESELAALGAKVDNLEGRVSFLESHQFSTTTKLRGEVIMAVTQSFNDDNQVVLGDRYRLALNTSFTGEDTLITRIAGGNFKNFNSTFNSEFRTPGVPVTQFETSAPTATGNQTFNLVASDDNTAKIDWIAYYAPLRISENMVFNTYIAGFGGIHSDYAPTVNPYFEDYDGGNGALSTFASENPIYRIGGGSGIAFNYEVGFLKSILGPTTASVSYLAGNSSSPEEGAGLFNGDYSILGQLNFNLNDRMGIAFTYVNGFHKADSPIFGGGATGGSGVVGTQFANANNSELNNILLGSLPSNSFSVDFGDKATNSYGSAFAWRISDKISFSAFFTYTNVTYIGRGDDDVWSYGGGLAFPDFGKEGNLLGIFAGVQPYSGNNVFFITDSTTGDSYRTRFDTSGVPIHVEAFYKYQLNDNISITPGVIWVSSPTQSTDGDDQFIGTLRTTFTF